MARTIVAVIAFVALSGCSSPPGGGGSKAFTESFETHDPLPPGWDRVAGVWRIVDAESPPHGDHAIMQVSRTNQTYPVLLAPGKGNFTDFSASVRIRLMDGVHSVSAGLVFRYAGPDDYYVARLSADEGDLRVVKFVQGRPEPLEPASGRAFEKMTWYRLELKAVGNQFTVSVDGQPGVTTTDAGHAAGPVGLWVKDDTVAQFDLVEVRPS